MKENGKVAPRLFDDAFRCALQLVQNAVPQADDMSLVRNVIAARITENIERGEHDPTRLAKAAISHVRQEIQLKDSKNRIIYGK